MFFSILFLHSVVLLESYFLCYSRPELMWLHELLGVKPEKHLGFSWRRSATAAFRSGLMERKRCKGEGRSRRYEL